MFSDDNYRPPTLVVRETLRVYSVVAHGDREVAKDTLIPLATPVRDVNGVLRNEIA